MKAPLKVGITGGIGSGKTTACRVFESLGIPVYFADQRAKQLMVEDARLRREVIALFGESAYLPDGQLNRAHIAEKAFSDKELLQKLNAAVHPAVAKDSLSWHKAQHGVPYTLKEAALLYESGSHEALDQIIVVAAPKDLRLQRVMQRDGAEESAVRARMAQQMPEAEKVKRAHFILHSNGRESLLRQITRIHRSLLTIHHEV